MARRNAIIKRPLESRILLNRGEKVLLDADLAELYDVDVKRLNEQVKRNINRFPTDFMFRLTPEEYLRLRSQIASSSKWGGRRYTPFAFTEHGAIMVASVLNSTRAIEMSVFVVRAFVRIRQALETNKQLAVKVAELEGRLEGHDADIKEIVVAIKHLMRPIHKHGRRIGFKAPEANTGESST